MATRNDGENVGRSDDETIGCTFQWKIDNVSHCWWLEKGQPLESPKFIADGLEGTKWSLDLYPMGEEDADGVSLYLYREESCSGPDAIQIKYQLAFLGKDGSILEDGTVSQTFKKGGNWGFSEFGGLETVFDADREVFLLEDTLTVQCTLRKTEEETLVKSKHLYAQTVCNASRKSFDWRIDKLSSLQHEVRKKFKNDLIEFDIVLNRDFERGMNIDIISCNNSIKYISCNTSIVDSEGKRESCGINKYFVGDLNKGVLPFILIFPAKILENKSHYLPNDVLFLDFDVVLSTIEHFPSKKNSLKEKNVVKRAGSYAGKEEYENMTLLINDLKSMYNDRILSDTELRTSTKTFPAHKNILSARSPVFKRMFSHDMKEKNSGHVDIEDLEDDTVHRMLWFMYTGFLEDPQLESASKLYTAADKYEILSLKSKCSSFLKDNLSPANACCVLLLADRHQDDELKNTVQVYILEHDEVFRSLEWKSLMNTNIKLAADIMYSKINPDNI